MSIETKYAELVEEHARLKVEKEKLSAVNEDLKNSRDKVKETNKTLLEKIGTLETTNAELTGKVSEIKDQEQKGLITKLATEEFKVKGKFAELLFKQAELGEGVDYTNLTEEQKGKVAKVLEDNPEFKLDIEELGGKKPALTTEEVLGVNNNEQDNSKISNM